MRVSWKIRRRRGGWIGVGVVVGEVVDDEAVGDVWKGTVGVPGWGGMVDWIDRLCLYLSCVCCFVLLRT